MYKKYLAKNLVVQIKYPLQVQARW